MDFTEYNRNLTEVIDQLSDDEIKDLHNSFLKQEVYDVDLIDLDVKGIPKLKEYLKSGITRIAVEDLMAIAPDKMKDVIRDFSSEIQNQIVADDREVDEGISLIPDETQESLIREGNAIAAQKGKFSTEIPKDLQARLQYIILKLNMKYKISRRDVAKLINLNRNTVNAYAIAAQEKFPDLAKTWSASAEVQALKKIDESLAKQSSDMAIEHLKGNVNIGNKIRDKFYAQAASRGINVYNNLHLEKLISDAVEMYFSNDDIYILINKLEREAEIMRTKLKSLSDDNQRLSTLLYRDEIYE